VLLTSIDERTEPPVRVIPYYSTISGTTSYIVSVRDSTEAIIIDPVHIDRGFYQLLLQHDLDVRMILLTQPSQYMLHPVRTLDKIFDFELVAGAATIPSDRLRFLQSEISIDSCGLTIHAIPVLPHSRSSFIYHLHSLVFTGSIVHAGTLGETETAFAEALLVATVKDYLFTLPADTLMLPSVGPPSTVNAERVLSPYYREG
jgi:hydroxyacylglutathione hydrolase